MAPLTPEQIARICYEANRALQAVQADPGIPVAEPWDDLPADQQAVVVDGVTRALQGASPRDLHRSWLVGKARDGLRYGPVKDTVAKTHPCMVSYELLPNAQRAKDALFAAVVGAVASYENPAAASQTDQLAIEHPEWSVGQVIAEAQRRHPAATIPRRCFATAPGDLDGHLPAYQGGMLEERTLDPAKPTVGRIVHYVSYGSPGGEYGRECRAAIIAETGIDKDTLGLAVLNPSGVFFDRACVLDEGECMTLPGPDATETATGHAVLCGSRSFKGGTWHWPVVG